MTQIINGKKYSTETAKEIESYWNGHGSNNFNHLSETLYQKKTGEFFLHGEGGPMTKYSSAYGSMLCDGEMIIPMTVEQAKKWAEKHMTAEKYEEAFGPVEE